ncbi:MFS transporter [Micromonospora globispora]|nr:MFS transporter [Micromonospora globispora]RQW91886.1 MFS transporter [Micromonospora globispora]
MISSYLGSTIEFYDFLLYALVAATVFDKLFFTNVDGPLASVLSFATLAVGYAARPVGGAVFGHFGDRFGRKSTLVVTMTLMGAASFLIGVLPTYATLGIAAPIILTLLRVVQGLAVGGEWGGAALMSLEHADGRHRGFAASFANMGGPSGAVLAATVLALSSMAFGDSDLSWRLPFLLSAVLVGVGLWIRLSITESEIFKEAKAKADAEEALAPQRPPLAEVLTRHPRNVLLAMLAGCTAFLVQGLLAAFIIGYAIGNGHERASVLWITAIAGFLHIFTIPAFAALSDRIGRRPVIIVGACATFVLAWPLFGLLGSDNWWLLLAGYILGNPILQASMYGPLAAYIAEMFGTRARYTGASLGYQLSTTLGAGFGPLVAASLVAAAGGSLRYVTVLVMGAAVLSALAVLLTKETRDQALTDASPESRSGEPLANV